MVASSCQVTVVGAGPYGLAAAAHLKKAGVETRVFGRAMEFWQDQMPAGMFLRSSWEASHISDPQQALTLDRYQAAEHIKIPTPVPLADFVNYGRWFQRQAVPDLDQRRVVQIEAMSGGFRIVLEDGETLQSSRVVVATGISRFAYRPRVFAELPPSLCSHACNHSDLARFAGQKVVVIGGGQSAIESAVLLSEHGADVEVIMRAPHLRWLRRSRVLHSAKNPFRRILYPPTDVGPPGLSWIVAMPEIFRSLPPELQQRIAYRCIRPAAAGWLWPRSHGLHITTGRRVTSATAVGESLHLDLDDGSKRSAEHILLATGYRVDVSKYRFLTGDLVRALRCVDGYPLLRPGFESSVPGLHFLGAPAARSFGPVMRFVSGTHYAARALAHCINN